MAGAARTLLDKIWDRHVVVSDDAGDLIYIDLHLVHEVSSPQAFDALRSAGRRVRRPDLTVATVDHSVPTRNRRLPLVDREAARQLSALQENCEDFGIALEGLFSQRQGIVHVMGPERGMILPGMTVVCGDSHTSTHGAFGALAFGIGTSDVEHVFATQALRRVKPDSILIDVAGALGRGCTAKDLVLRILSQIGTDAGRGAAFEYSGPAIDGLSMDERMTVCNMSIEGGARAGLIAPDATTLEYLDGRPEAPKASAWRQATVEWEKLVSDVGAEHARTFRIDAAAVEPTVTWGTTPAQSVPVGKTVPRPSDTADPELSQRALDYMALKPGTNINDVPIDRVFIGSCTNSRLSDLRSAADVARGRKVADQVRAIVVPGSTSVKKEAELEGLHEVFLAAGFEWRDSGCSMCVGMNDDIAAPGERCASTSNRNFEGRQGPGARTHLVSPAMAAAAAIHGHFVDVRDEMNDFVA